MLTARQKTQCREIAAALDAHNQAPWLKAEPSLGPEEKALIWDERQHVKAMAARRRQREAADTRPARIETESRSHDLDYWAADDKPDECDDDEDSDGCDDAKGQSMKTCPRCGGSGEVPDDNEDNDGEEE